jgi:hypothetical protein
MISPARPATPTDAVSPRRAGARRRQRTVEGHGLRFAFYGRMSTVEFQDRTTSLGWQREVAEETIRGNGVIVAEYFDEGCSRRLPWRERPAAAQLMAAAAGPNRSFDAVVIGEYERAFYGDQFDAVLTALQRPPGPRRAARGGGGSGHPPGGPAFGRDRPAAEDHPLDHAFPVLDAVHCHRSGSTRGGSPSEGMKSARPQPLKAMNFFDSRTRRWAQNCSGRKPAVGMYFI